MKNNIFLYQFNYYACIIVTVFISFSMFSQQDPQAGLRASWMKGVYGLAWKMDGTENGGAESDALKIDTFLDQVKDLQMLGYIQLPLTEPYIYSPVHKAPHSILESLWQGDTDSNGNIINLVVPRASSGKDPFLDALIKIKAAGLRTEIYVNFANLLQSWRSPISGANQKPNPSEIPNISARWKNWCDTNPQAQAYINSATYISNPPTNNYLINERKYMFCYAEFILKEYSERYGALIDAWTFDAGKMLYVYNSGENFKSGNVNHQLLYKAFADAARSGNPDAAISFNNGQATDIPTENPYPIPTFHEDYTFGHPFYSGRSFGLRRDVDGLESQYGASYATIEVFDKIGWHVYDQNTYPNTENANKHMLQWATARNGNPFVSDGLAAKQWDNNIVAHMFPPIASVQWDAGGTPGLSDPEFVNWFGDALSNGVSVTLGAPLIGGGNPTAWANNNLRMQDFALDQLELLDNYLIQNSYSNLEDNLEFSPDPDKSYFIDNVAHNVRLAATGSSEDAYTQSITNTSLNAQWKFVYKEKGYWHIELAKGGTLPRLRTDNTNDADMQSSNSQGAYTYFKITPNTNISGTYYITLPDANPSFSRLQVDKNGNVKMNSSSYTGTWVTFRITETGNAAKSSEKKEYNIDSNNTISKVFPNPTSDQVTISLGNQFINTPVKVTLINTLGKKIFEKNADTNSIQIFLKNYNIQKGIYLLTISSNKATEQQKIVIK